MPTELGKLINMKVLAVEHNQLTGTLPFTHVTWFGRTSLPLAKKDFRLALAGSIPTEFGELINLNFLSLCINYLTGTPLIAHLNLFCTQVYRLLEKRPHSR
jgi:hypothetical protein